jgi:hypothetical protein
MVNELHEPGELMGAAQQIADKIAGNSPTAVQAVSVPCGWVRDSRSRRPSRS